MAKLQSNHRLYKPDVIDHSATNYKTTTHTGLVVQTQSKMLGESIHSTVVCKYKHPTYAITAL